MLLQLNPPPHSLRLLHPPLPLPPLPRTPTQTKRPPWERARSCPRPFPLSVSLCFLLETSLAARSAAASSLPAGGELPSHMPNHTSRPADVPHHNTLSRTAQPRPLPSPLGSSFPLPFILSRVPKILATLTPDPWPLLLLLLSSPNRSQPFCASILPTPSQPASAMAGVPVPGSLLRTMTQAHPVEGWAARRGLPPPCTHPTIYCPSLPILRPNHPGDGAQVPRA